MEFLKQIFYDQNKLFVSRLENQGFSSVQANDFLYEVATTLSVSNPEMDVPLAIKLLISQDPANILQSIDIKSLAQNLGVASIIAELGIKTIQPDLSFFMSQKKDDILNTIISLSWGSYGQPLPLTRHIFN
jgi:DUF4097 and DUF4098 domain-containing protein YvlB